MHNRYHHNKFLIVSFIGFIILGFYVYFYNDMSEASGDSAMTSSLTTTAVAPTSGASNEAATDTAFLMKLASLTKIKIDTSLFSDQSFKILVDNNIKLESVPYGRPNPFSPTSERSAVIKPSFYIRTSPATLITMKSAVLNGSLEGATSNSIYFEYGETLTLGKVTSKVTPTSNGSFSSSLNLLPPKTTFFYRAAANINGVISFGNIMSFNTN